MLTLTFMVNLLLSLAAAGQGFVTRSGDALADSETGEPVYLRGINFNNFWLDPGNGADWIIDDPGDSATPVPYAFGDKSWFEEAAEIGFNVVRVTLSYRLFEDNAAPYEYKASGFDFVDQYIEWAEQYGLYLILDMHVPPGGLQNNVNAANLWTETENQHRLLALWHEIADRYAGEPVIAAYDLLNEPTPVNEVSAWQSLAAQIADTVRAADQNHLLIVEYAYGLIDEEGSRLNYWNLPEQQVLIDDANTMYDFHYYEPMGYALQCYNESECPGGYQYGDPGQEFLTQDGTTLPLNREFFEYDLPTWLEKYRDSEVPVNIGEWAPWAANYQPDDLGGIDYIQDLLSVMEDLELNWQYYCHREFIDIDTLNTTFRSYFMESTSVSPGSPHPLPGSPVLEQNFPNPFNPTTVIGYRLAGNSLVRLEVFDVTGRKVAVLVNGEVQAAGRYEVDFDAMELNSGVYIYRLDAAGSIQTRKMLLIK